MSKKQTEKRRNEIVFDISYTFQELLETILIYYGIERYTDKDIDKYIDSICNVIDFRKFSKIYCKSKCDINYYHSYIIEEINIEELLIHKWNFQYISFENDFIKPTDRDIKIDVILE